MAVFPLHQIRIPPRNSRRAGLPGHLILPFTAVLLIGLVFRQDQLALVGLAGAFLSAFAFLALLTPLIVVSVMFMLAPPAGYIIADFYDYSITGRWWFWTLCLVSIILAIITLKTAGKRYPRRNEN